MEQRRREDGDDELLRFPRFDELDEFLVLRIITDKLDIVNLMNLGRAYPDFSHATMNE